jgi:hypothetical protein
VIKGQKREISDNVEPPALAQEPMWATNGTMVSTWLRFGQSYNENVSLISREVLDFSRTRLSRNAVAAQSIARCTDWSEASKIQQDWLRATTEEYMAEMGKLFQLAVKTTMDSCRPLQDQSHAS